MSFPDDYEAEELAGKDAVFEVTSRRSARRSCPSSTTTSRPRPPSSRPSTSSGTRSARIGEAVDERTEEDFREAASTPPSTQATIDLPDELVAARAEERWSGSNAARARGMSPEAFLQMQAKRARR